MALLQPIVRIATAAFSIFAVLTCTPREIPIWMIAFDTGIGSALLNLPAPPASSNYGQLVCNFHKTRESTKR